MEIENDKAASRRFGRQERMEALRLKMRIAAQHLPIFMTGNERDLLDRKSSFK